MLVLSRTEGQTIVIDGRIRVTIVAILGTKIRVGVDAPRDVVVDREEIWERKRNDPEQNREQS